MGVEGIKCAGLINEIHQGSSCLMASKREVDFRLVGRCVVFGQVNSKGS